MKSIKKLYLMLAVIFSIFIFGACSNKDVKNDVYKNDQKVEQTKEQTKNKVDKEDEISKYPLTLKDSRGNEIVIEKEPQKIISVAPNITETIFAVGAGNKLVGRTDYCDYPKEAETVESIGTLQQPNIEKIVEIKPDLVIGSTHFKKEVQKKLTDLGIKVVCLYNDESFDGAYDIIDKVGKITNHQKEAKKIVDDMKEKVKKVEVKVKGLEKPTVYFVVGYGKYGDFTATGETFLGKLIEMAGGENVAKEAKGWKYNIEKLVEQDPDILICSNKFNSKAGIQVAEHYKDLTAVKKGKLFEVDENLFYRQGPRLADGLLELAKIIHPEAFK